MFELEGQPGTEVAAIAARATKGSESFSRSLGFSRIGASGWTKLFYMEFG